MIEPYKKGKDIFIMIWAAIWGTECSELIIMSRDSQSKREGYSANSYIKVLEEVISTCWESDLIFMQDNASIYKTGKVKKWFGEQGIPLLNWPPYLSDLNPTKHCWIHMK